MQNYYIERLNNKNANIWEEFNNNSSEGSFFHSLKWKQIFEDTTHIQAHYFLFFKDDIIFGIFPFFERNIHFFRGLVPLQGFGHHNAIILDHRDSSAVQYLIKECRKIKIRHKKISFIGLSTLHMETLDALQEYQKYPYSNDGNMILNLRETPPDKIWNTFSAKKGQRKFIRRFDENGFKITELNSLKDLELFYRYYKENINTINGILQPFSHFALLYKLLLSDEMRVTLLSKDSVYAGGLLMFTHKPQKAVYLQYLSLNRNLPNAYHPTYYLFWEAINWAWTNHYDKISFGAQQLDENNPRYHIKKEFGGHFEPLYSNMIPLSKMFTLGHIGNQYINRFHLSW